MSVQFGRWSFDAEPADRGYLDNVGSLLAPYGPDAEGEYSEEGVSILYRALHTTRESRDESQPHLAEAGRVMVWDGRLDNRSELIGEFPEELACDSSDVSIVSSVYARRGTESFPKLIGDWALSVWEPRERSLILAKDALGTRPLYYAREHDRLVWSTLLDPLLLFESRTRKLDEEYIAGWLSFFPSTYLTPYVGIEAVPAGCFVRLGPARHTVTRYWDFDPSKRIHYHTDREYEEHFRTLFAESVRRRLRSDAPVLADLSGGMDSSSIVCMADTLIAAGAADPPRLDTVSYFDDSEPHWNERLYFSLVEEMRGRQGCHIAVRSEGSFNAAADHDRLRPTPGSGGRPSEPDRQLSGLMISRGIRVRLSGIGGDEVTGGVPSPTPELANLLAEANFRALAHRLRQWALVQRKPWLHVLLETARPFFPARLAGLPKHRRPPSWLRPDFAKRHRAALAGYEPRWKLRGPLPSFQEQRSTFEALCRQLACHGLPSTPAHEKRYPLLDRDLLEFLCAIPPEQLLRPGQRRSLLRRALAGIVPDEILNRRRKAYVARGPSVALSMQWEHVSRMVREMRSSELGIVDGKKYGEALESLRAGRDGSIVPLLRAFSLEMWLKNIEHWNLLDGGGAKRTGNSPACPQAIISSIARNQKHLS
jgi:asparagine synthase (glutamine-hydrolysing)